MSVTIKAVRPNFVGELSGIDLREQIDASQLAQVRGALKEFAVLVLPGQSINDEQQARFSALFGELEMPGSASNITKATERRLPGVIADLSNLDHQGNVLAADARQRMFNLGNRLWHSDSSFKVIPAQYSMLSARIVPESGGDTQFADMTAAYNALDEQRQAELESLVGLHSLIYSRGVLGFDDLSAAELENFAHVRQRLVRTHPLTGQKSLYLSAHAGAIEGWLVPEARALLRDLTEEATAARFVYAHQWNAADLVIWDNQRTMHRARPFADKSDVRDMHRTTVAGVMPTIEQIG